MFCLKETEAYIDLTLTKFFSLIRTRKGGWNNEETIIALSQQIDLNTHTHIICHDELNA